MREPRRHLLWLAVYCALSLEISVPKPACAALGDGSHAITLNLIDNQEIWTGSERSPGGTFDDHNAFTDLVRFQGDLFVSFRESTGHVPGTNGRGTVLRSTDDGATWNRVADLRKDDFPAYDLRDPKLTVTPSGQLMAYASGANYTQGNPADRRSYGSLYNSATDSFGPLTEMVPTVGSAFQETQSDWLWRMTWNDSTAYGIGYRASDQDGSRDSYLYSSTDGIHWDTVTQVINPLNHVGETTIRFDENDDMYLLARGRPKSGGANNLAWLGQATAASGYTDFSFTPLVDQNGLHRSLGGPNMIFLPSGEILVASRKYSSEGTSNGGSMTNLAQISLDGTWRDIMELPSGGDTSYPGLVLEGDTLYVSYYSRPTSGGDPHIYFATLDLDEIVANVEGDLGGGGITGDEPDGMVNELDWQIFSDHFGDDLSGLSPFESYFLGDMNGDLDHTLVDFQLFRDAYEDANGAGAFDAMLASVPEPSSLSLLAIASSLGMLWRRKR